MSDQHSELAHPREIERISYPTMTTKIDLPGLQALEAERQQTLRSEVADTREHIERLKQNHVSEDYIRQAEKDFAVKERRALEGISILPEALLNLPSELKFDKGLTLLVGHNGSGKSTLSAALFLSAFYKGLSHTEMLDKIHGNEFNLAVDIAAFLTTDTVYNHIHPARYNYAKSPKDIAHVFDPVKNLSQRQSREAAYEKMITDLGGKSTPSLITFDEFETGLDPWRHGDIEMMLRNLVHPDSTVLVATNSPVLVLNSNLPRIDLRFPQRGVHLPTSKLE